MSAPNVARAKGEGSWSSYFASWGATASAAANVVHNTAQHASQRVIDKVRSEPQPEGRTLTKAVWIAEANALVEGKTVNLIAHGDPALLRPGVVVTFIIFGAPEGSGGSAEDIPGRAVAQVAATQVSPGSAIGEWKVALKPTGEPPAEKEFFFRALAGGEQATSPLLPYASEVELNPYVLEIIEEYDARHLGKSGKGKGYFWPRRDPATGVARFEPDKYPGWLTQAHYDRYKNWKGNIEDYSYHGTVSAHSNVFGGKSYCCGITYEVLFKALERYCSRNGKDYSTFKLGELTNADVRSGGFYSDWFLVNGPGPGCKDALVKAKVGTSIESIDEAKPGDFCQMIRSNGTGHSVIFLGREGSDRFRYWSSQGDWGDVEANGDTRGIGGVGSRTEPICTLHIARVVLPV